jgi:membrane associated rhomboid family serine protease
VAPVIRIRTEAGEEVLELEEFEARVKRGELAGHCPVSFAPLTGAEWVRADQLALFRRLSEPRKLYFSRAFNLGRFPRVTAAFIVVNVALYLVMGAEGPFDQDALVAWGAKVAPLVFDLGQLWRLLTANLLHQNLQHIAFNLFVLFNVGGALENAYRRVDYLLLLFGAALGTTLMSLWRMPEAVTAGASGIVYGVLGGAVVFGIKYRELLPQRYRRVLGEATIPTVLAFLYIGFTARGVDNWAHLGGLLSGAAAALFLKARLLHEQAERLGSGLLRLTPAVLLVLVLSTGGWWFVRLPAQLRTVEDELLGLELAVPRRWWKGAERAEGVGFHNGLSGLGRASFDALAQPASDRSLERVVADWLDRQLAAEQRLGALAEVSVGPTRAAKFAGRQALLLEGSYSEVGPARTLFRAHFVQRGELVYALVFQWPADYPDYRRLVEQLEARVRMVEPAAVREARARAAVAPGRASFEALAETLLRLGEPAQAAAALSPLASDADGALLGMLAGARIAAGDLVGGCRDATRAVELQPPSARAREAMSDCLLGHGDRPGAAGWLRRAAEIAPDDLRIRSAVERLGGEGL